MARTFEAIVRMTSVAVVVAVTSVALPGTTGAETGPPPPAVDQYVEMVPTAGGPKAPRAGKKKSPLPKPGKDALKQAPSKTASTLEEVATSSTYGAPAPSKKPDKRESQAPVREPDRVDGTSVTLASAGVMASASVSDTRLLGLLGAVLLTMLGAVALAIGRARTQGP
jgi:hypothetical protein